MLLGLQIQKDFILFYLYTKGGLSLLTIIQIWSRLPLKIQGRDQNTKCIIFSQI